MTGRHPQTFMEVLPETVRQGTGISFDDNDVRFAR